LFALSTLYRGDKDDNLTFWFRMYDRDRDGFLDKEVGTVLGGLMLSAAFRPACCTPCLQD
jgi:hypothetical protein